MNPVTKNHHYLKRLLFSSRSLAVLCCAASVALLPLPKAIAATSSMEYYHYNHQGSLLEVYDGSTNKRLLSQAWSPWGERQVLHAATGDRGNIASLLAEGLPVRRGYTGHKTLLSTGLTFAGDTRLYDSRLKRFLNSDNRTTGGIRGQNRYSYAYNNPMTYVDLDGHAPKRSRSPRLERRNVRPRLADQATALVEILIGHAVDLSAHVAQAYAVRVGFAIHPRRQFALGGITALQGYRVFGVPTGGVLAPSITFDLLFSARSLNAAYTIQRYFHRYRLLRKLKLHGRLFRTARRVEQAVIQTAIARLHLPATSYRRDNTIFNRVFDSHSLHMMRPKLQPNNLSSTGGYVFEVGSNMSNAITAMIDIEQALGIVSESEIEAGSDDEDLLITQDSQAFQAMIGRFSVCYGLAMAIKAELPCVYQQFAQIYPGDVNLIPNLNDIDNWDFWPQE